MALNNLGVRYSELGRRQEALAPTEEALKIYLELAKSNPAYLPDVANALNNLGVSYSEVGRRQEALAPTEEAVKIYLEQAKSNPAYLPNVAMALNNLGVRYSELGRRQEALAPTEEAVKIYRELAKSNPAYLPDVARALNYLGYFQVQLGQPEQAHASYEEAIALYQPLAATNPAFQEGLQQAINNLEELNRQEGIKSGKKVVSPGDRSFFPKADPSTPLKRSVLRLLPTFTGEKAGIRPGTAFVVKRQGDRAWIATARHVVFADDDYRPAVTVEAELYAGDLPEGVFPPRLQVVLPRVEKPAEGDDLIILEVRGLPADVQPLPLSTAVPSDVLTVVGHPTGRPAWSVMAFKPLKSNEQQIILD